MNNLLSYCGLVDMRINASDKNLPVQDVFFPEEFFFATLSTLDRGKLGEGEVVQGKSKIQLKMEVIKFSKNLKGNL